MCIRDSIPICQMWPCFCFHTVLNTEPTFNMPIFKTWLVFVFTQFWTLNLHLHGTLEVMFVSMVNVGQFLWYSVTMSVGTAPVPALCTQTAGELFTVHLTIDVCHLCKCLVAMVKQLTLQPMTAPPPASLPHKHTLCKHWWCQKLRLGLEVGSLHTRQALFLEEGVIRGLEWAPRRPVEMDPRSV